MHWTATGCIWSVPWLQMDAPKMFVQFICDWQTNRLLLELLDSYGVDLRSRTSCGGVCTPAPVQTMSVTSMAMTSLSHLALESVMHLWAFIKNDKAWILQYKYNTLWMLRSLLVGALPDSDFSKEWKMATWQKYNMARKDGATTGHSWNTLRRRRNHTQGKKI